MARQTVGLRPAIFEKTATTSHHRYLAIAKIRATVPNHKQAAVEFEFSASNFIASIMHHENSPIRTANPKIGALGPNLLKFSIVKMSLECFSFGKKKSNVFTNLGNGNSHWWRKVVVWFFFMFIHPILCKGLSIWYALSLTLSLTYLFSQRLRFSDQKVLFHLPLYF